MAKSGLKGAGARLFAGRGPISAYVLKEQLALLDECLPRARGATLLEVNCGEGAFLPFYRGAGFDVWAAEADYALRQKAAAANRGVEVYPAPATRLPWQDNSVDWVVAHLRGACTEACARESLRVALRGVLIAFWNSASLAALCWKLAGKSRAWPESGRSAFATWRLVGGLMGGRMRGHSTLFGPVFTWRESSRASVMNSLFGKSLLGAWCVIRVDLERPATGTPLGLTVKAALPKPLPAMEYSQKNISGCRKDVTDS